MTLELLKRGLAPAAIVLGTVGAIIGLGVLVGIEMGLPPVPLLTLASSAQASFRQGVMVTIHVEGRIATSHRPKGRSLYL